MNKPKKEFKFDVIWSDGYNQKCKTLPEAMRIARELMKMYSCVTIKKL